MTGNCEKGFANLYELMWQWIVELLQTLWHLLFHWIWDSEEQGCLLLQPLPCLLDSQFHFPVHAEKSYVQVKVLLKLEWLTPNYNFQDLVPQQYQDEQTMHIPLPHCLTSLLHHHHHHHQCHRLLYPLHTPLI